MSCDPTSQSVLKRAVSNGRLSLDGDLDDSKREGFVEKILAKIASENATETVTRELDMLTDIHDFHRTVTHN